MTYFYIMKPPKICFSLTKNIQKNSMCSHNNDYLLSKSVKETCSYIYVANDIGPIGQATHLAYYDGLF